MLHFIFLINTQGFKSFASPDEVFALHIFHKNSLNLIETVREKLIKEIYIIDKGKTLEPIGY